MGHDEPAKAEEAKPKDVEVKVGKKKMAGEDEENEFGGHGGGADEWTISKGLTSAEAAELLAKWGKNELAEKSKPKWKLFVEQFYQPMPCMIWCAIAIEGAIENWPDFGILLGLQFINGTIGFYEASKAGDAVAALKKSLKPKATCKRDGKWAEMDATLLVPGDLVTLNAGAAVPADCRVNQGRIEVDQAALTGESLPVTMMKGSQPKMGSTVTRGETEGTVEFTGGNTFFGKTAAMIQSVEEMSHFQRVLLKIMFFLLGVSFFLCGTILIYLLVRLETVKNAISYVVVLLVASIPLAMEVVTTTTMAIGSRELAAKNAIVARLASIEELAGMNMLCSDKTGTLTLNKMVIQEETPIFTDGYDQYKVLRMAALAAKWHEPAKDALDTLVLTQADLASLDPEFEQIDYMPFDPIFKRTEGTLKVKADGSIFKVSKGAPHIIVRLTNNEEIHEKVTDIVNAFAERGIRSLAVARTVDEKAEKWVMLGILTFLDPPRPDTKEVLARAMEFGIDVKMITGDHVAIAKETCRQLNLGTNILNADGLPSLDKDGKAPPREELAKVAPLIIEADGFAQVFPEHKFLIVEALRQQGFAVGMTGDGVNDAPALKKADIGIAVQGATDAARAAADIVLTSPGLSVVIDAITISRCIFQRIQNFVLYRVACTLQLLVFFFIAVLAFHPDKYAKNAGATNALLGSAVDFWTSANRDGSMIAWHQGECDLNMLFFPNIPSGSWNLSLANLNGNVGYPANAPTEWLSAGYPSWMRPAPGDMNDPSNPAYDLTRQVYCSMTLYNETTEAFYPMSLGYDLNPNSPTFGDVTSATYDDKVAAKVNNLYQGTNVTSFLTTTSWDYANVKSFQQGGPAGTLRAGWVCTGPICIERWRKYFNLPVIALIIITLLNDGTIISIAYDYVEPSKYPEKWNLPVSYMISGTLGGVACASSILYLHLGLDSHRIDSTWHKGWGLPMLTYGNVVCMLYLKVSLSDFLTLFSARTTKFFFSIPPAKPLLGAAVIALGCSTCLAALWPFNEDKDTLIDALGRGSPHNKNSKSGVLGVTWLYVFIWWGVQDVCKYLLYVILEKFDILHAKTHMFGGARGEEDGAVPAEMRDLVVGHVEKKQVAHHVRETVSTLTTLEKHSQDAVRPKLELLEKAMSKRDNAAGVSAASGEVAAAVENLDPQDREKLQAHVMEIKSAATRAEAASASRK